ncbi:hypothetical protein [Streptomyces sp. WM4235]|nr:hypothetical protein [Streptomyces sp. WM4235]
MNRSSWPIPGPRPGACPYAQMSQWAAMPEEALAEQVRHYHHLMTF